MEVFEAILALLGLGGLSLTFVWLLLQCLTCCGLYFLLYLPRGVAETLGIGFS